MTGMGFVGSARRALVCTLGAAALLSRSAAASNPLEYPENGTASFSRGGAWLAVGNEPIAAHYNPAALALQSSGASVEQQLNFAHTCFSRRAPGDVPTGPDVVSSPFYQYRDACESRSAFPFAVPSIAFAFRISPKVGVGIAVVPPATYGTPSHQFPAVADGVDTTTGKTVSLPAPYRYQTLEQQSLILFPTASVGWEVARGFRVGAGFVAGVGIINLSTVGVANLGGNDALGDHMTDDSLSSIRTRDLFVPGAVFSVHWSVTRHLDVSAWGRILDSIRTSRGSVSVTQQAYDGRGRLNPPCAGAPTAQGTQGFSDCSANQSVPNDFPRGLTRFEYPIPPEIRWGARYHAPRSRARDRRDDGVRRDPLVDDVFDVELDQSLTLNAAADEILVRFPESAGTGSLQTNPTRVPIPPNADRPTGYRNSYGARLGGQWNVLPGLLGLRAGAWCESRSQDPRYLTIQPIGAARFGFGGGVVVRYHFLDVSVGYQRHITAGLDNHGDGELRAPAAVRLSPPFNLGHEKADVTAADRREFRTEHAVNGGHVTFDAHVFSLGLVARF